MHGGARDKKTALMHSAKLDLKVMARMCDNSHTHLQWGATKANGTVFATAAERVYPKLFCRRLANAVRKQLGYKTPPSKLSSHTDKVSAGFQPRKGLVEIVPEYAEIRTIKRAEQKEGEKSLELTGSSEHGVVDGPVTHLDASAADLQADSESEASEIEEDQMMVGCPWTEEKFVERAATITHPFDRAARVPPAVAQAMTHIAAVGPSMLARERRDTLRHYSERAKNLEEAEKELHSKLNVDVQTVVTRKKILLFKEMLYDIHYDDPGVADLLTTGIKIVGTLQRTGIWTPRDNSARCSKKMLWAKAKQIQLEVMRHSPPGEHDQHLWDATMDEVADGCPRGPFTPHEVNQRVGSLWVAARRFPVIQGEKLRPVDDFSACMVNAAFGAEEKISLKSLDSVVGHARAWISSRGSDDTVTVTDTSGREWSAALHDEWKDEADSWQQVLGRITDLKSAYRQLPCHPAHRCFGLIGVKDPTSGQVRLFETLSLMFGETAAVYAFLRFSRALAAICSRVLHLVVVEFFDDFIQLEAQASAPSAQDSIEQLFDLLGWDIAMKEAKRLPFNRSFVALGVQVNLPPPGSRIMQIQCKPGRIANLADAVEKILATGQMSEKQAASIKGKLGFTENQVFCRIGGSLARLLSHWHSPTPLKLTAEVVEALRSTMASLESAGPRSISPQVSEQPVLLFTDGACEEVTTVGGIIFTPCGAIEYFGAVLTQECVESFKAKTEQKQVIGQAEIVPVLIAKLTWRKYLEGRRVLAFIDNDAARIGLIRSYSPVLPSLKLVMQSALWDYQHSCSVWYSVPPLSFLSLRLG